MNTPAPPLLTLKDLRLGFGGTPLFDGVNAVIGRGERLCLVGRNGSGKSTLLKVVAGLIEAESGEVAATPGTRIAYLPQEPSLLGYASVRDYVAAGLGPEQAGEDHRADILLESLMLEGAADPATLSGGETRRAALARVLIGEPDVLLLDEPTNHLDLPTILWLEKTLEGFRGALVLISHDRAFLSRLTRVTLWLDRGVVRRLEQGFAAFEDWAEAEMAREDAERARLDKKIAQETIWSRQGISARRKRNQGRLRRLYAMRAERASQIARTGSVKMTAEAGEVSGKLVVEADAITKSYGPTPLLKSFSTRILRGDRVGVIGPNGAGKSTLLKMLTGVLEPDSGTIRLGTNLTMTYLDQTRSALDLEKTIWDTLADSGGDQINVRGTPRHVVSYMRDFLFEDRQARSPIRSLSGGERNRLLLAKALARPSNLLVLDEPTNDLDIDTLDLLEDMLADYDGTLLVVSHDRDFLDRVVTSTIVLDGDGLATEYAGGYSDALTQRGGVPPGGRGSSTPEADGKAKDKSRKDKPADAARDKKPGKLSYKQQRALEELPKHMAALERDIARHTAALADASLFQRDPKAFQAATTGLETAQAALTQAEEEWLELELLREELSQ